VTIKYGVPGIPESDGKMALANWFFGMKWVIIFLGFNVNYRYFER